MKGIFISFEGPDGSGKSTQVKLLAEYCKNKGIDVVLTREPGGTPISENIRNLILDPKNGEMSAQTEALLYAASRAQHVEQLIKPALATGKVVLCDRFMDSSIAYQGYGRGLGDDVRKINEFAIDGVQPDLTFFLDIAPEEGMRRVKSNGYLDRMEQESILFHNKVYQGYLALCEIYKNRFVRLDATKAASEIHKDIVENLEKYVAGRA